MLRGAYAFYKITLITYQKTSWLVGWFVDGGWLVGLLFFLVLLFLQFYGLLGCSKSIVEMIAGSLFVWLLLICYTSVCFCCLLFS
jgi:hypothetical protein